MCILRVYASVFLFFMFRFFSLLLRFEISATNFRWKVNYISWYRYQSCESARARTHTENEMKHESSTACSQTGTRTINGTYHRKKHTKINQTNPKKNNNNRNNTLTILFDQINLNVSVKWHKLLKIAYFHNININIYIVKYMFPIWEWYAW